MHNLFLIEAIININYMEEEGTASKILLLPLPDLVGKGEVNYPRVLPGDFPCPLLLR